MTTAHRTWGRAEQQDFRSRVRGCLLGGAIGDALGAGVADASLAEIRAGHGPQGVVDFAPAHGRRGAVTAGTQMGLFTVDGLIRAQVRRDGGRWHPPTDVHAAHRRWYATQKDWGPDERKAEDGWLAREEWLYAQRGAPRSCLRGLADDRMGTLQQPRNPEAKDPGAVVRSAPFGLLVGWEPQLVFQLAAECATQTHGHPTGYLAAGAYAVVVHGLARGDAPEAAVRRALEILAGRPGHDETTAAVRAAVDGGGPGQPGAAGQPGPGGPPGPAGQPPPGLGPEQVERLSPGETAAEAVAVALYCALAAADVRHGLLLAVNHGGGSDTTGALCGSLLGAQHGETALPPAWVAEVEGRGTILQLADDFALEMTLGPALHGEAAPNEAWLRRYPR
ncbi:ADP-ribosylglycohydrolase family protein [Streptomyces synnematoformans]|uniref:ADP-ribosylglycohydrolase family protein n=1 Tax=Streptomyces synnematoformans TaxID=415721 RepID=A0ABN1ZNA7_9ACTN